MLAGGRKVGAFVETKNVEVGAGSKVPHLSYVGDADHRRAARTSAPAPSSSTTTASPSTARRSATTCASARDTMLVAPVTVGDGAYTAAGSVITDDVPPGALAVARAPQRNVAGWVRAAPRRAPARPRQQPRARGGDRGATAPEPTSSSRDQASDERDAGRPTARA